MAQNSVISVSRVSNGQTGHLLAEVNQILSQRWYSEELEGRASDKVTTLNLMAASGLRTDAEASLAEIRELKEADNLAAFHAAAAKLHLDITPLDWVEPALFRNNLYHISWRSTRSLRKRERFFGLLGRVVEEKEVEVRQGGLFRKYQLTRAAYGKESLTVPLEAVRKSVQIGSLPGVEEASIFDQVQGVDPILAVQVGRRWFMIYQWD